ncbi:lysine transporter LysE [Priestia megaterium]|uniref:Lysine transporter LysE n=1 Tax=Priestia megaterium TaxID=1404 RepID=A0A3D8X0J8_PRIMG|nr:LysE family translocator [Priestia megaterium]MDH3171149.1 LysE family translocator [Priestia megaterium]RDZ13427.1 lysine transporter LysE [Priestia megaterium]
MNDILTFLVLTLFVIMSPGIDTALITKRTVADGQTGGYKMALGLASGSLVHTLAATFGLSALLLQSALAFEIVKYAGALYLMYLGISAFLSKKSDTVSPVKEEKSKETSAFRQGLVSNVLNPKVAVFFLTFLPQFVQSDQNVAIQLLLMGITYTILAITWFFVFVFFINYLRKWLTTPSVQRFMDKATGVVLIGFGLKLAFEKHK